MQNIKKRESWADTKSEKSIFRCHTVVTVKKDVPQKRTTMPRTKPSCACSVRTQSRFVRFHNFTCGFGRKKKDPVCIVICNTEPRTHVCTWFSVTSPSQEPESRVERLVACLAMQFTPSLWPSRAAKKGLASTLSSLVVLRARVYSLHTSNGWRLGS